MKLLLFLLCLITASVAQPPIIAASYLGCGFDAKTGMLGLAPIFEFTYNNNQIWVAPSGTAYAVPDQMYVSPRPEAFQMVMQGSYYSYSEFLEMYTKWFSFDIGIDVDGFSAGFKYDKQLGFVHDTMNQAYGSVIHGTSWWTYYTADMYPFYILKTNSMFQQALDEFPENITNQNELDYATQFVNSFGTHYMQRSVFGGRVDFNAAINQVLSKSYSYQWIVTQYGFYFHYKFFNISGGGFANKTSINVSQEFIQNSNSNATFYGGDQIYNNLNNLTVWVNSIEAFTYPLNSTLAGLWNLVTDNATKQKTMEDFIVNYYINGNQRNYPFTKKIRATGPTLSVNGRLDPAGPIPCLGMGIDTTTLDGCLAPVYIQNPNNTYILKVPDSQLIQLNLTMTDSFNVNAWSNYHYTSSYGFLGMGTETTDIYQYYNEYFSNDRSLVMQWLQIAYYEAEAPILPAPELDPIFVESLDKLPPTYDSSNGTNKELFYIFLQTFGLGVVDQATFGGYFECKMWYGKELVFQNSGEQISEYASWSFLGIIGDGHGHSSTTYKVNQLFNSTLEMEWMYFGGNITYGINEWALWLPTIKDDMAIIQYHLLPITMFVENNNTRANLVSAMTDYATEAEQKLANYIAKFTGV